MIPHLKGTVGFVRRVPFLAVILLAAILCLIGDKFPLSPFPMYANPDTSADVLFVTDENGAVIHTKDAFNQNASGAKKDFEGYLNKVAGTKDYEKATAEQVNEAGQLMLKKLLLSKDEKGLAKYAPKRLRLMMFTITLKNGIFEETKLPLAECAAP